ncbi:hypothetical protein HPP92_017327 [Vanilla planifolia]|uniref:WW domain-containing protein n=1 Tax=Vanilla planifolia TaxID=51239 RepID=A0A835QE86_VANPL|nr:hypothetical protein HPP92_017327 [Vanilla planifolia]
MGKRKERRLAAMSAARRVKLDLFAEPSEDKGCSANEEVGGDREKDHSTSLPTSSLSGHKQENPLLLLGQYSDDELDDEGSKHLMEDMDADGVMVCEAKEHVVTSENLANYEDEVIEGSHTKPEPEKVVSSGELETINVKSAENSLVENGICETDPMTEAPASGPHEGLANGHVDGHWKLVLHDESNQYYYWNTVTGETSWEVPTDLSVDAQTTNEPSISIGIEETVPEEHISAKENVNMGIYVHVSTADNSQISSIISQDAGGYQQIELNSENIFNANQSIGHYSVDNVSGSYGNLSGYQTVLHLVSDNEGHLTSQSDCYGREDAHCLQLVNYGEGLLQRLDALYGSASNLESYEEIKKEIDIRISDCRALSSYGSALLPFWWHTEARLKQIESALEKCESSVQVLSEELGKMDTGKKPPKDNLSSEINEKSVGISEAESGMNSQETVNTSKASPESNFEHQRNENQPEMLEANPNSHSVNSAPTQILNVEDDMDVEMEVDDETPSEPIITGELMTVTCPSHADHLIQPNQASSQSPSFPSDDFSVPPPPEEEWIPPPPPEGEPLPPPPPPENEMDSSHEPTEPFPPSYTGSIPCPYPDQYNLGYTVPAYDYYSSTVTQVPNGIYYVNTESSQLTESETPAYYDPFATSLPEVTLSVPQVDSATYYDAASVAVSSGSVFSNVEPPAFYVKSAAVSYKDASCHSSDFEPSVNSDCNSLPKTKESQKSILQSSSPVLSAQAPAAASGNDSALDTQPPTAPKNQTKVLRSKKRTVTVATNLRSNKKVSSLVDKWKAAKEELHGEEEEEPEDALDALQKKRQKEIEEWRARQVASGEAQDNANFVPLGGDWRERVKRRRAAAVKAEEAHASADIPGKEKKDPSLVELSKDLPTGWQAYWDESTKQVYYGNLLTSETTWTRPTK